jgi:hypothetical protein
VQAFYKNPAFPLVPSTDEIRRVLYQLITDDWELVDADGNRLAVASPAQISINSINQTLRRRQPDPVPPAPSPGGGDQTGGGQQPGGQGQLPGGGDDQIPLPGGGSGQQPGPIPPPPPSPGPTVYRRYRVQLSNKSITGTDARGAGLAAAAGAAGR